MKKQETMNTKNAVHRKEGFVPRTPIGEALLALRSRCIESGMKLLSEDEILDEVKRRRGEHEVE